MNDGGLRDRCFSCRPRDVVDRRQDVIGAWQGPQLSCAMDRRPAVTFDCHPLRRRLGPRS